VEEKWSHTTSDETKRVEGIEGVEGIKGVEE
jgi:hypothetical protein